MIYIHNNPDRIEVIYDAVFGDDYIEHSTGRMNGVNFNQILLTDDSNGEEIAEAKWKGIRRKRDILLVESDKHVLFDFPQTQDQENRWIEYRQQLRDVTEQDLNNFVWPTPPY